MKLPPLYDWQEQALANLRRNKMRGIVVAVTGTGKTRIGIETIRNEKCSTLIVVPTVALMNQWKDELLDSGIRQEDLGLYYGEVKLFKSITIAVINSVYKLNHLENKFKLLIMDELHRYASANWQRFLLNNNFKYRIGLTATLERSDNQHDILIDRIGDVVYEYNTKNAVSDGMLNKFKIINYGIDLPPREKEYLSRLDDDIKRNMERFDNDISRVVTAVKRRNRYAGITLSLINKRKKFYNNSIPKVNKAVNIIRGLLKGDNKDNKDNNTTLDIYNKDKELYTIRALIDKSSCRNKIIVFGEYIDTADQLYDKLKAEGIPAWVYYSGNKKTRFKLTAQEKREVITAFKEAKSGVLITVKALDEGLNVKDANVGILLGYNKTDRQAIQRMGRILRKMEGKNPSMINLYYTGTNDYFSAKGFADLFEDTCEVEWK